jgi:glycosyltransferase involved in cell wall biosynthesis
MKPSWTIYFWEPSLSPHKIGLVAALAARIDVERCIYVTQLGLDEDRSALGWTVDGSEAFEVHIAPDSAAIDRIFATAPDNAIHLFSGIHWVPCIVKGLASAIRHNARFGILSEPRVLEGIPGKLRLLHSWITERSIRRHTDFVLAIGGNGPRWFRLAGYGSSKIFPFAYFLGSVGFTHYHARSKATKIGYLGRLTRPKGLPLFLEMLENIKAPVEVTIAGAGDEELLIETTRAASKTPITFHGVVPMPQVSAFLENLDILVVPSISDDGWGAVISEALLSGTYVITTPFVGGAICVGDPRRGMIVGRTEPGPFADAVDAAIASPWLAPEHRQYRANWADQTLTGDAGARYLIAILTHVFCGSPRPAPFYAADFCVSSGQST